MIYYNPSCRDPLTLDLFIYRMTKKYTFVNRYSNEGRVDLASEASSVLWMLPICFDEIRRWQFNREEKTYNSYLGSRDFCPKHSAISDGIGNPNLPIRDQSNGRFFRVIL